MKRIRIICLSLAFILVMLSACGQKDSPGVETAIQDSVPALQQQKETSPSFSEQDVLFPPADHPPYSETFGSGGERTTAFGNARSEALYKDYFAFWDYFDGHPESLLKEHCAGAYTGDVNDLRFIILLDEPENSACIEEIERIGLRTDYVVRRGSGTEARLTEVKAEIDAKLEALREKKKDGTIDKDAAMLLETYKPEVMVVRDYGNIAVILSCKCIWYGASGAEQEADRAKAIALFEKYVGKYDVVTYGFPV